MHDLKCILWVSPYLYKIYNVLMLRACMFVWKGHEWKAAFKGYFPEIACVD